MHGTSHLRLRNTKIKTKESVQSSASIPTSVHFYSCFPSPSRSRTRLAVNQVSTDKSHSYFLSKCTQSNFSVSFYHIMVSLGHNFNMNTGAQYMDEQSGNTNEPGPTSDREQLLDPVLAANSDSNFTPLKTVPAFSVHLLISTVISFTGILLASSWPPEKRCEAYFIMLYLRVAFWIITYLFDHFIKYRHEELRLNGYHEFHRSTAMHKGVPLSVVSLWNTAILAVQALMQHYYGDNFGQHCLEKFLSPITYITAFNVAETAVLALTHGSYISRVLKFNKAAPPPDALSGSNSSGGSLGLVQPGGNTAELLEKQADLISYLKDHNLKLNQKLMHLNSQVRTVQIN